jgi:hypothetical protein
VIVATHDARKAQLALSARPDAILGPLFDLAEAPQLGKDLHEAHCAYIPALGSVLNAFPPQDLAAWIRSFPASAGMGPDLLTRAAETSAAAAWAGTWSRQNIEPTAVLKALKGLADAGVAIAFGTASGLPLVFHGSGAQMEVALMAQAGLSPRQIVASATVASRELMGCAAARIEPGGPADLVLVAGDPGRDAGLMVRPRLLFLNGVEVIP